MHIYPRPNKTNHRINNSCMAVSEFDHLPHNSLTYNDKIVKLKQKREMRMSEF